MGKDGWVQIYIGKMDEYTYIFYLLSSKLNAKATPK